MITRIRGGKVFAPERWAIGTSSSPAAGSSPSRSRRPCAWTGSTSRLSTPRAIVVPGFIDTHVHILGGGGEGGPATRAPEIRIEDIVGAGVTTVIGCLGTDGITRHMESLLAKARGLEVEGVSTYIFSGSYEIPVRTLTGSVRSDLVLIDKIIGAGEIAISDHRSSQPTFEEFARLAAECRVGGMLGGKGRYSPLSPRGRPNGASTTSSAWSGDRNPADPGHAHPHQPQRRPFRGGPPLDRGRRVGRPHGRSRSRSRGTDPDVPIEECIRIFRNGKVPMAGSPSARTPTAASRSSTGGAARPPDGRLGKGPLPQVPRSSVRKGILGVEEALRPFATNPADFYKLAARAGSPRARTPTSSSSTTTSVSTRSSQAGGR